MAAFSLRRRSNHQQRTVVHSTLGCDRPLTYPKSNIHCLLLLLLCVGTLDVGQVAATYLSDLLHLLLAINVRLPYRRPGTYKRLVGVECAMVRAGDPPYSDLGVVSGDLWVVDQQNSVHTLDYCRPARFKPACMHDVQ